MNEPRNRTNNRALAQVVEASEYATRQQDYYNKRQEEFDVAAMNRVDALSRFIKLCIYAGVSAVLLLAFLTALIGNIHLFLDVTGGFMALVLRWLTPGVFAIVTAVLAAKAFKAYQAYQDKNLLWQRIRAEIKALEDENTRRNDINKAEVKRIEAEAAKLHAEATKLLMTHNLDEQGNLLFVNPATWQAQLVTGQMRQLPNLSSYHHSSKNDTTVTETDLQALNPGSQQQQGLPSIERFYEAIQFNSLQTGLGAEATTGKLILAPIRKSVHFKLIGGSGQGKSCVAGAILDIATTTNDPDHLRIGLLDLEHNTSRLFENLPHVAEIGPKRQRLVGGDADEVAQKFELLFWELRRRSELGETYCTQHEPVLLVYVEEMLALKHEVVDKKLRNRMLEAFSVLAVRGRKYGIFFLACMQADYSDTSTREGMAQFRTRGGFAIDPEVARASGFFKKELVLQNFQTGQPGQYVLEQPQYGSIALAPSYDVAARLEKLDASATTSAYASTIPNLGQSTIISEASEAHHEATTEALAASPLRTASQANRSAFTPQEQRYIHKFLQEGLNAGQIVSTEFTNSKGEPLTGGDKFVQRNKEVQDVLRRYMASMAEQI
jgi:hypothetical protein